ncbi:MAG: mediator complex subunit [Thelocarpon superellum]|nr:MAG: mediator complex subunit [Thelocarpon superellum]
MDGGLDMNELFGEEPPPSVPPAPIRKGLSPRIEELRLSGCCTRVAWSKIGNIAYINRLGDGIILRNYVCHPEDGKWGLTEECPIPQLPPAPEGQSYVHLGWSHSGSELAVVDTMGRVAILSVAVAMNRFLLSRPGDTLQEDDLGAVAGMIWLQVDRQFPVYRPAVKADDGYQYLGSSHKTMGPFHPYSVQGRSALICLTRGGAVRLLYQQVDQRWLDVKAELETLGGSIDVISHASFATEKENSLLLLVRTVAAQHHLFRVEINWNLPAAPKPPTQPAPLPVPKVIVSPIKTLDSSLEDASLVSKVSEDVGVPPRLSHLELIPVTPHAKNSEQTFPTIIAVFSHLPDPDAHDESAAFSTILRWELRELAQKLHGSFDQLTSKKNSASAAKKQSLHLVHIDGTRVDNVVLSVQQLTFSLIVALTYSDGTIEYRDRMTMKALTFDDDFQKVGSLAQVGFAFPAGEPCLHTALSQNFSLAVTMDAEGEVQVKSMQYSLEQLEEEPGDPRFEAAVVALTLQLVYCCTQMNNADDILALGQRAFAPGTGNHVLSQFQRALSLNLDYTVDPQHERLFRNPFFQQYLSMQHSMGYRGDREHRTLTSKSAWITLQLRNVARTFAYSLNSGAKGGPGSESDYTRPEVLQSLFGILKWSVDVNNFLVDELLALGDLLRGQLDDVDFIQRTLRETNSCALLLILGSVSRTFLRYNARALHGLSSASHKGVQATQRGDQKQAFTSVMGVIDTSPVKVSQLERMLAELDNEMKTAYQTFNLSEAERSIAEKTLLVHAQVAKPFQPVIKKLFSTTLDALRREIDPAAIYFADYSWLGLSDDRRTDAYRRSRLVDCMKKVPISPGVPLRRCTRCCAYMEDAAPGKTTSAYMASLQKACFCGSLFRLVDAKK